MNNLHLINKVAFFVLLTTILTANLIFAAAETNLEPASDETEQVVDFDMKMNFYLDLKTKRFLERLSIKEELLTDMIKNVIKEVKAREKNELLTTDIGFEQIYGNSERILTEYNSEIETIKQIINELAKLELVIQRKDDLKLLSEVEAIKEQLAKTLEDSRLGQLPLTNQELSKMIHDYSAEVNNLLKIFEDVNDLQKRASYMGDAELIKYLEMQKQKIVDIFEQSRIAGAAPDRIVQDYITEAASIADILRQIDQMKGQATMDSTIDTDIENVHQQIISSIDNRILDLFGVGAQNEFSGKTVSDYFKDWKTKKISDYQIRYSKYRILREKLIATATIEERNRMLEAELSSGLLSYAAEKYELAENQFDHVLQAYQEYFPNLDGVIFYKSEANYAKNYYDEAQKGYLEIVEKYPTSQFLGVSNLRLLAINYAYHLDSEFFKYFDRLKEFDNLDREDVAKAHYLAANLLMKQRKFEEANLVLESISSNSKYYMAAQYLQGIALLNLDLFNQAKNIFESLIDANNYPWTDLNVFMIRNEALLKLGYLHYQRGEYERALAYFDQLSKGSDNYDDGLLGQAWSKLKTGQYNSAIGKVELLCSNYLMSNYTYEALVLSAHCKRAQHQTQAALTDLRYVANAKRALNKMNEYNEERARVLDQLDELEVLEEKVLEQQNRELYPKIVRVRDLINEALTSFKFRGAASSSVVEEYSNERKLILRQLDEFEKIISFAETNNNQQMLTDATKQRDRMLAVLKQYQLNQSLSSVSYFMDYPLAAKEGGVIYRRGIFNNIVDNLLLEKRTIQNDLQIVTELAGINAASKIDIAIDLEMLEEDLNDLNNQLNKFQVWLGSYQIDELETQTVQWADFSGFGISDINFGLFREKNQQALGLSHNLSQIESLLEKKRNELEEKILRFDSEVRKIQSEMEAEKVRLEKLEKEKYFQEIYFETKTREIEQETEDEFDNQSSLDQGAKKD